MKYEGRLVFALSLFIMLFVGSCTWVKLTPEGDKVNVAMEGDVKKCSLKGQTTVSLKSKVMGIKRDIEQVRSELITLARNSAVNIGGNTIVSASNIEKGKQTFEVYLCK